MKTEKLAEPESLKNQLRTKNLAEAKKNQKKSKTHSSHVDFDMKKNKNQEKFFIFQAKIVRPRK
ncbi:MAG: hypothetical protein LBK52_07565 [Deltaproteobacteria bacterium]|nr:hypothetical protein [Deltaproteobacteria bacterium]